MEQPAAVVTSTESPSTARPVATSALPPGPSIPTCDPTTAREPNTGTTLDLAAVTNPPSTEPAVPQDLIAGTPTARAATTTFPRSGTTGTGPSVGTVPACSLQIWSLPPTGMRGRALRIECRAQCAGNATVGWLRTPAALSQYQEESAGSSSALRLDRAEPWHQGQYQCVLLGHRAQMVSLEVMVVEGEWWPAAPCPALPPSLGWGCSPSCWCHSWCWGDSPTPRHLLPWAASAAITAPCACRFLQLEPCHCFGDSRIALGAHRDRGRVSTPLETIQIPLAAVLGVGAAD